VTITLYHCHESRSMRSLWLLNELGLEFDLVVMPFGRELRAPEYLAIHPLGRVPCLVDDELTVFESGAIAQYLCETYDDGTLHRAPGHRERVEWLQWLHFSETMAVHAAALTQQYVVIEDVEQRSPLIQKLEKRRLEKCLEVLDEALAGRETLLASGFSGVDVAIGVSVHFSGYFTPIDRYANLGPYYQRMTARPAFQASLPPAGDPLLIYTQERYGPYDE